MNIIFDCDGVLVDSEPLSIRVSSALLAEHGVILSPEEAHQRFLGKSFPDLFTQDAISDCQKGNYAKGIPVLEKRLRSSRVTLPSR